MQGDLAGHCLERSHVSSATRAHSTALGGGVDSDEDDIRSADSARNISGEEQIGKTGGEDNLVAVLGALALARGDIGAGGGQAIVGVWTGRLVIKSTGAGAVASDSEDREQARLVDG